MAATIQASPPIVDASNCYTPVKRGSLRELKEKKKGKITRRPKLWSSKSPMMNKNDYHCQSRKEKNKEDK